MIEWKSIEFGKYVENHNVDISDVADLAECKTSCEKERQCKSIDYGKSTKKCHLNSLNSKSSEYFKDSGDDSDVFMEWEYIIE